MKGGRRHNRRAEYVCLPIPLQELERRSPVFIQRSNLAVDGEAIRLQRFEGIDQDRIIVVEALPVARNQADLFISLDCKGPIPVKLHFVDPVSGRKIPDWEGHHGLGKRKDVCGHASKLLLYPKNSILCGFSNSELDDSLSWDPDFLLRLGVETHPCFPLLFH
jgi:hypothetical protein